MLLAKKYYVSIMTYHSDYLKLSISNSWQAHNKHMYIMFQKKNIPFFNTEIRVILVKRKVPILKG